MKTVLLLLVALLIISVVVYAASDTVTIDVNISTLTQITVTPDYLNFTQVSPGSQPTETRTLTIENIGSTDVTSIYATIDSSDRETSNPIGTGTASNYAAGGFIVIKNVTSEYYFPGRLEWNDTVDSFAGATWPTWTTNITRGWIRNGSYNYLFALTNGTNDELGLCNGTGTLIHVEADADDGSGGTRDLSSGHHTCLLETAEDWYSIHTCPATSVLGGMCVAAWNDCSRIMIYQWDYNSTSTRYSSLACTNKTYISTQTYNPQDQLTLTVMAWVPKGTPAGNTSQSVLWITAAAA